MLRVVEKGYTDVAHLKKGTNLDALRERARRAGFPPATGSPRTPPE